MADTVQKTDNDELHEAMESAYNEVTAAAGEPELKPNEPVETQPVEESPEAAADAEDGPGRARDPKTGKFVPKTGEEAEAAPTAAAKPAAQAPAKPTEPQAKPEPVKPAPVATDPLNRAPQSWRAQARDHWAELDKLGEAGKAIKEEAHRREREVNGIIQKTAEARAFADEFQRVLQPYAPIIAANGHTPLQSVQGLMQTAAALQMGPPGQKAAVVAAIMRNYGIDVELLAQALEQNGVPQGASAQQAYDPRVDQLVAAQQRQAYEAQQRQQQYEAQQVQQLQQHYEEFERTHEFFQEVRASMATIISVKAEQEGVDFSDEEAYKMALALRPDLMQKVQQREELAQATSPSRPTARAAAAAVSLKPGTITAKKAADPDDLHAVMAESYDEVYGSK